MLIERYDPLIGEMFQILDKDGNILDESLVPKLDEDLLKKFYEIMVLARSADEKAIRLQRQGRMGTYASCRGQEASQIGSVYAMGDSDWLFPTYRDIIASMVRGVPLENIFLYWMGNETGNRAPEGVNVVPVSIPVGTQTLHAVGAAWAAKIKGDDVATLVYFGDGGTSKGDFHEAMNFAGVFKTPTVFFCQNNQWAISVPRSRQTGSPTLAQKALAYGFQGVMVDGNDVLAVYVITREAIEKAHAGAGPTFIEAYTYRMGDHTTADDATRYREEKELKYWEDRDPIKRYRIYLEKIGIWNKAYEEKVLQEVDTLVDEAIRRAESVPGPSPEDIFRYTYEEMPWDLREQMEYLIEMERRGYR